MDKVRDMKKRTANGFTLIEVMVSIAVLSVLLGIAVPAFKGILDGNRVVAITNEFRTALSVTQVAAGNNTDNPVTLCPSNAAQDTCVDSTDWATGWIAFTDNGSTPGTIDTGETILQKWPALSGVTITQTGATHYVRYDNKGRTVDTKFEIKKAVANTYPRCIYVKAPGQVRLSKVACT